MTLSEWKDLVSIVQSGVTGLSLFVAAWWVWFKYLQTAENRANVGLECEIEPLIEQREIFIVEVIAAVTNRGKVPYKISSLDLCLLGREYGDAIEYSKTSTRNHLRFSREVYEGSFIGANWTSVVDPGVTTKFRQVVTIPREIEIIHASLDLKAPGTGLDRFCAERTIVLRSKLKPSTVGAGGSLKQLPISD